MVTIKQQGMKMNNILRMKLKSLVEVATTLRGAAQTWNFILFNGEVIIWWGNDCELKRREDGGAGTYRK